MKLKTKQLTIMALMVAVLIIFAFTPIGSIPVGPLVISLQVIPVAISAIVLGPKGGAIAGACFGLLSFLQCFGIGIPSAMGAVLVGINPFLAFIQRFVPRLLDGILVGFIYKLIKKKNTYASFALTGLFTALLNTIFFMFALVWLFGNTEYIQGLMGGKNIIVFICTFVGLNAVVEMIAATVVAGAVGTALYKAGVLNQKN
ncbi:MAG: ECF transporter S component [Oscillospiraceae bacterium]|nr:ECF transporter S component [Oscillospiraceae bacterium]